MTTTISQDSPEERSSATDATSTSGSGSQSPSSSTTSSSISGASSPTSAACRNRDCPKHFPWRPHDARWYACQGSE